MSEMMPRLMLAGVASGAGKTTMTCAVLQALVNRGLKAASFKCGPDYIDPMFHASVIGAESRNLDLFLCDEAAVRYLLARNARGRDISILEGVMGYYDGVGASTRASSYHLASQTRTPVALVLNARGMALSAAAVVRGFASLRPDSGIAAVLLNQCGARLYPRMKEMIERETGLPVLGYLPPLPECALESRHLGLVTAAEVNGLQAKLARLAAQAEESVEIDALLRLARAAEPLEAPRPAWPEPGETVRVAVAFDKAFCFYYKDALDLLRELGAELVPFSPLADAALPDASDGLLLGGGYPELYARRLSENAALRGEIGRAVRGGLPCLAECGGFMYLHRVMEGADGVDYEMAGALDARCYNAGRLQRFGYAELEAREDGLLGGAGVRVAAHEFHHWESEDCGGGLTATKPGGVSWSCGHHTGSRYLGFPHLHLCGAPEVAARFLERCRAHARARKEGTNA